MIEWYDACSKKVTGEEYAAIMNQKSGKELMVINKTFGKVVAVFDDVVVVLTEDCTTGEKEITVIPRGWIIKPKKYVTHKWQ